MSGFTGAITDLVSNLLLNPLQSLLADSPWWLMALVLLALAYLLGGLAAGRDRAGLRADHPGHRDVEREHEDAHHHADRHRWR